MIPTPPRVLLARDPIDLRKGIAGLAAICRPIKRSAAGPLDLGFTPF